MKIGPIEKFIHRKKKKKTSNLVSMAPINKYKPQDFWIYSTLI